MAIHHTVVWLDHREARVFHFDAEAVNRLEVHAPDPQAHVHNKASASGRREEHEGYWHAIAQAVGASPELLIVGPSTAKLEFIRHLHRHDPETEKHIVGIETVDHPTDGQLVAYARKYFRAADRMR